MKSHIAGSSLTSKASLEDAIKHGEMQELFALYRICIAIAANEAFGFGILPVDIYDFETDVEVIGNIYDNPELIGGRTNE